MRKFRVYAPALINSSNKTIEQAEPIYGDTTEFIKYIEIEAHDIGDEYHTMHELYQHRMALTIALFHCIHSAKYWKVLKSKQHHDDSMFEGYFIVMLLTDFGQISYHYKLKHWDKFKIPEVERAPKWDGHTSIEVLQRLEKI